MSSPSPVELQQKMIASWSGRPVDARGLLRVLNENGSRPPLLWIFNTSNEPERLAEFLGKDQPLLFSRSTHLLVRPEDDPVVLRRALAGYLLVAITNLFPNTRFDIGSSCQGTGMVMNLCSRLPDYGIDVGSLCLINCSLPDETTNRPALLIYGDEDPGHDPFEKHHDDSDRRALLTFSTYKRHVVHAQHGTYYSEESLKEIVFQFDAFRRQHETARSTPQ